MATDSGQSTSRRDVLAALARYGSLCVLAGGSAAAVAKRRRLVREGKCINNGLCGGCRILDSCARDEAVAARDQLAGASGGG